MARFACQLRSLIGAAEGDDWRKLLLRSDPAEFARHLMAALDGNEKPWLILVDELPIYALQLLERHGREALHDFLYEIRRICQENRNVRWLYTGSIGLDAVARRHGLEGALVDLEIYPLAPFSPADADAMVRAITARAYSAPPLHPGAGGAGGAVPRTGKPLPLLPGAADPLLLRATGVNR